MLSGFCQRIGKFAVVARRAFFLGLAFSVFSWGAQAQRHTVSGYVKEADSGELLPGVTVYVSQLKTGTTTNLYGFYSLTLEEGTYSFVYSFVGFQSVTKTVDLDKDTELSVDLGTTTELLEEVEIVAEEQNLESERIQMSKTELSSKALQDIPALFGEKDVLKALQLMPGVQSGSEGNAGIYVRGGGPGENLFILDDAVVYNANHLFGFFSVFNGDALKATELYKGGFPARYGGRLSSVINMSMKDGNKKEYHGKVGVGLISSQLVVEGPIWKEKTSFLVSARRTYIDLFTRPLTASLPDTPTIGYFFHDINTKFNHVFRDEDKLYLSFYYGLDRFDAIETAEAETSSVEATLNWGNITGTLRWNHQYTPQMFSNTSLIFTDYGFRIGIGSENSQGTRIYDATFNSVIQNYTLKYDLEYFPSPRHSLRAGFLTRLHYFNPNSFRIEVEGLEDDPIRLQTDYYAFETPLYVEDEWRVTQRLDLNLGFRLSNWRFKNRTYTKNFKGFEDAADFLAEVTTRSRELDEVYWRPEPRIAASFKLGSYWTVKSSYTTMYQYLHLLTNSGASLPTDLWVAATKKYGPQRADQAALGLAKDLPDQKLSVTLEGYYKWSREVVAYQEGAVIAGGPGGEPSEDNALNWETLVTQGDGEAYGVELFVQRSSGKFRGWVGYTLAWTLLTFEDLNRGNTFFPKYDRRHDVSIVLTYDISSLVTLTGTWVYGTGNNVTIPKYRTNLPYHSVNVSPGTDVPSSFNSFLAQAGGSNAEFYVNDGRFNFRAEPYHRMDIGLQRAKRYRLFRREVKGVWEFAVYNAYNRLNPFYYSLQREARSGQGTRFKLIRNGLFPIIPSVTYRIEF